MPDEPESKVEKPRKRRLPRRVKIPLIIVAVPVVLLLVAQVLVSPVARSVAQKRATATLGTEVRIGSLSVNLFTGRARVKRLTVANPPAADGTPVPAAGPGAHAVSVDSIDCDVSLRALLGGRVVVQHIEVDGPSLLVERGRDGTTNLERLADHLAQTQAAEPPEPRPAAEPRRPTPVTIERLRVRKGLVRYVDRSQGDPAYEMRVEDLAVTADGLTTDAPAGEPMRPVTVTAALASGDERGSLSVEAFVGALKKPFNAKVETNITQVNLAGIPLATGAAGDLRVAKGLVLFTSSAVIAEDMIQADQQVKVRNLAFGHSAGSLNMMQVFGVPVEVLNVFLGVTDGLLYVNFPIGGTVDKPEVAFEKAFRDTIAAGPKAMLERIAALPGDFLKAGKDIGALTTRAVGQTLKVFDPRSWRDAFKRDTGPGTILSPSTRPVGEAIKDLFDPKTWGRKPSEGGG